MALTPSDAAKLLDGKRKLGRPAGSSFTPEQLKARARARSRAADEARTALVSLHPEDYRTLYDVAVARRLAAETA